jgi:hypothetical protein
MHGMFVFNLNFNLAGYYAECEQMRFYAVANRPAETALRDMPKQYNLPEGVLAVDPADIHIWQIVASQPFTAVRWLRLANVGAGSLTYTVAADSAAEVVPTMPEPTGTLQPGEVRMVAVTIHSDGRSSGSYGGKLMVTTGGDSSFTIPITLTLAKVGHTNFLPIHIRWQ